MITYTYQVVGEETYLEIEQKITDAPLTTIERDGLTLNVKRVISGGAGFILKGGCWGRDNYSHGIQNPAREVAELKASEKAGKL